jgi:hypothetical protein
MGALPNEELIISEMYNCEKRLAEGLTKEGDGRWDECPALLGLDGF